MPAKVYRSGKAADFLPPTVRRSVLVPLAVLLLLSLLVGCTPEAPPAGPLTTHFYHWEQTLELDSLDRELLDSVGEGPLFVRAFDVVWEDARPWPRSQLAVRDSVDLPPVVPVVFLTNEVMRELEENAVDDLARDIALLIEERFSRLDRYPEVQFDCDWTATTRQRYFAFLTAARRYFPAISCTLRLHQYRDRTAQGIPPVDRVVLMAYNTGELDEWATDNSIFDRDIVRGYLAEQPSYPLPLDIAVAVYDWAAVYRRDRLAYLLNEPPLAELADTSRFHRNTDRRYTVIRSTYLDGIYLYRGDQLRYEVVTPSDYRPTAEWIRDLVGSTAGQRLLLYRLGSRLWRGDLEKK